jgi:hypothetical protein
LINNIFFLAGIGGVICALLLLIRSPDLSYNFLLSYWRWLASISTLMLAGWLQVGHFKTCWALVLTTAAAALVVGP